jgi:hypothetical protein
VLNPTVPEWARLTLPILRRPAPAVLATAVTGVAFGLLEGVRVGVVTAAALAGFLLLDRLLTGRAGGPVLAAPRAAASWPGSPPSGWPGASRCSPPGSTASRSPPGCSPPRSRSGSAGR